MKPTRIPRNAAADRVVKFVQSLTHSKGEFAGQPFRLRRWQEAILRRLFGTLREDGRRQYRTCYIEVPRKNGKLLALDTPLPTPSGWIKMGDIAEGTVLFDERGQPCRVVRATEIREDTEAYRVVFSDGTSLVADAGHLWKTRTKRKGNGRNGRRRCPDDEIHTTAEIRATLWYDEAKRERNHAIAVAGALVCPPMPLALSPYILGLWLGDGASRTGAITLGFAVGADHDSDRDEALAIWAAEGFIVTPEMGRGGQGGHAKAYSLPGLHHALRMLGVLGHKHVPAPYLRGSIEQRHALLQGLMDSDGHCTQAGQCEFSTTNERLRDGMLELGRSLGLKPTLDVDRARIGTRDYGEHYRIQFWPHPGRPPFRLARKRARVLGRVPARSQWRQITAIDPVDPVPMRCIAVDSPSHLYLAGDGMLPTHNTELAAAVALYMLLSDGEKGSEVYSAAVDRDQASLVFRAAEQMVRNDPELSAMLEIIPSQRRMLHHAEGGVGVYRAIPADAPHAHGFNASAIIYDELHAAPNRELWDVLTTSVGARRQPLTFVITTAGFDRHSICWELHEIAEKVRDGVLVDPTFLPVLYGAPAEADWLDERVWHAANPALGDFRELDEMRTAAFQAREVPARQNTFRRLYLCTWTESETRWLDPEAWAACGTEPIDLEGLRGRRCHIGLDLSSTSDLTACVAVFSDADGGYTVVPQFWIPGENLRERVRRDRVPYDAWARDGFLEVTEGNVVDYGRVYDYLVSRPEAWGVDVAELDFDPWNATGLVQRLQDGGLTCVPIQQTWKELTSPTKAVETLVKTRRLRHGNHPVLRWCAGNVVTEQDSNGNLKASKRKSTERIDGIAALITALSRAMTQPDTTSVYDTRGVVVA